MPMIVMNMMMMVLMVMMLRRIKHYHDIGGEITSHQPCVLLVMVLNEMMMKAMMFNQRRLDTSSKNCFILIFLHFQFSCCGVLGPSDFISSQV